MNPIIMNIILTILTENYCINKFLWNNDKTKSDYKIYQDPSKEFTPDVNIVLCETNHHLFYDNYYGPKIAYNVWESTLQPEEYFNKLKEFDELWVPSKMAKRLHDCARL